LSNIWRSYNEFKKGKKPSQELEIFNYYLEDNLYKLHIELNSGKYKHGGYKKFIVKDNKRREISVANIKDRVVHRLLYECLNENYDKTFIYDLWSCRKGKGLLGAIKRTQEFLSKNNNSFVWRADIEKFFDSVNQEILLKIIYRKTKELKAFNLIKEIIRSYNILQTRKEEGVKRGIPIGNLTSQILANIYLNELDRFVKHDIKSKNYLRYGDDFIIIADNLDELGQIRKRVIDFLNIKLQLELNRKNDIIVKTRHGLKFLGFEIFPRGRWLKKRSWNRAKKRLNFDNISSYSGLVKKCNNFKKIEEFNWRVFEKISEID